MEVTVVAGVTNLTPTEAVVLFVETGGRALAGLEAADAATQGLVSQVLQTGDFKAGAGQCHVIHAPGTDVRRVVLAGVGKPGALTREALRGAAGRAAITARDLGAKAVTLAVPAALGLGWKAGQADSDDEAVAQMAAEGALLSQYQLHTYRTQDLDDVKALDRLTFAFEGDADASRRGLATAQALESAIAETRRLILAPGDVIYPETFAAEAKALGEAVGLEVTVLDRAALEKKGMGAIVAVGQGSEKPPTLITIRWNGGAAGEAPLAFVGKGVTFDTGGIGIKPGAGMEKMKYDMAGGAAVLGAMLAVAKLGLKRNVVGVIGAAENMPSGTAIKPGDIVTSYAGLTIEVNDTDAEGRVVLADALTYTVKDLQAEAIVDMATLTGAVGVALGLELCGVMGNHQGMVDRVLDAGERAGERGWQLPVMDEFEDLLKSDIADLKNYGGRYAGASAAGAFLEKFVGQTPWVHLDIAGVGWTDKDKGYRPKGPTGAPVRLLVELARNWKSL
jgi:leucyl aminopeptidase